jgi:MinD-like ATPase involved in chromosome partitioning or flagellar assembly
VGPIWHDVGDSSAFSEVPRVSGQHSYRGNRPPNQAVSEFLTDSFPDAFENGNGAVEDVADARTETLPRYPSLPEAEPEAAAPGPPPAGPIASVQPAAEPPAAPPSPAATPRPEDLLLSDTAALADGAAEWGWRGWVNRITNGGIALPPTRAERAQRQAVADIQRGFSRPMTVVVIQPKGGGGKTPTTVGLAAALGSHRGGYVVGLDNNETRGTLSVRVANPDGVRATMWDLLSQLPSFERPDARVGDLSQFVRPQGEAHFDALVSDDSPANMAQLSDTDFQRIHAVLQRFYRLIVVDTGNNVRSPIWQAAVNAADVVVVVSTYQRDVGYGGSWVLDHLLQTGREALARNAVTVLTAAEPRVDGKVRTELLSHFAARTRTVVEVPYDPGIAAGGPIRWTQLTEQSRRAWVRAGATVVTALAAVDPVQR